MTTLPNIPRVFTAIAEWLSCVIIILELTKSKRQVHYAFTLALSLVGQILLQNYVGTWPLFLWIIGMIVNVLWMFLTLQLSSKISMYDNFYNVCKAFIFAEFIAAISWQLYCYLILQNFEDNVFLKYAFIFALYIIIGIIYYHFDVKNKQVIRIITQKKDVFVSFLTAIIIFTMSNIGFMLSNTAFSIGDSFSIFIFRSLINLCGIFLLYIQENQRYELYLKNELSAINNVFHSQYEQYQAYKESNSVINQKFHDLKHQINLIEMETNSQKQQEYFKQIREDIKKYESSIKTGNAVMDTILTHKNVFCIQNNISFTCIADGSLLDFLNVMDVCSLVGNTLDNAIESTLKTEALEKRIIKLRILKKAQFILYSIENYTESSPRFENGLPKTTKTDPTFHGYGLKSISYIAEKYGGSMTIKYENSWFSLNVLIPAPVKQ